MIDAFAPIAPTTPSRASVSTGPRQHPRNHRLYDYPHGRPDTVELNSSVLPTDGWLPYPVTMRWIPDAFSGPMRALLADIAGDDPWH